MFAAAALALVGAAIVWQPAQAAARPLLKLSPKAGGGGTAVRVQGSGFARNASGFITFGRGRVAAIHTNRRGRFVARFLAPLATPGRVRVTALVRVGRKRVPGTNRFRARSLQRKVTFFRLQPSPPPVVKPVTTALCGSGGTAPALYDHVIWITFENQSFKQVIGNTGTQPFINELAGECGLATNFFPERHPSLPNYIAMTSGSTQGITGDSSGQLNVDNIFNQVKMRGREWRQYSFGMPSNCYKSDAPSSSSAIYTAHHEAVIYYPNVAADCAKWDIPVSPGKVDDVNDVTTSPLAQAIDQNALPAFAVIGPSDDGGNSSLGGQVDPKLGDPFLKRWISKITSSTTYQAGRTAIFITWDEGGDFGSSPPNINNIATIVVAPSVPEGATSAVRFDHYSMLRTTEEMLGITSFLGNAATAASMRAAFHL